MAVSDDIRWFKSSFSSKISGAIAGTPLTIDLLCAIALQETGYIWRNLRAKGFSDYDILRLCVGDTIDAPSRSAPPANKASLLAWSRGREMFDLSRRLLVEVATKTGIRDFVKAVEKPDKFCRGFGMFQRDLQFFPDDADYFLNLAWTDFDRCLAEAVTELKRGLRNLNYADRPSLSDRELSYVAIVYNMGFGNFRRERELKQGYKDGDGIYYGEHIADFLSKSKSVTAPATEGEEEMSLAHQEDFTSHGLLADTASSANPVTSLVDIALRELATYSGLNEGEDPLKSHIDNDYWKAAGADPKDFSPTADPWSAAFISYCVRKSGATPQQFQFSTQHSVFVHAAIENAQNNTGVFRGRRITEYAPKLGDIIQNNRTESDYSFEYARTHSSYPSHSAIVVDFETREGARYAVTIGGNESDSIRKKLVPLRENGMIRQRPNTNYYICVIENLMTEGDASAALVPGKYKVVARPDLNLRAGPGTTFNVKDTLAFGTVLYVVEFVDKETDKWALVDLQNDGGRDGFVFAKFIVPA